MRDVIIVRNISLVDIAHLCLCGISVHGVEGLGNGLVDTASIDPNVVEAILLSQITGTDNLGGPGTTKIDLAVVEILLEMHLLPVIEMILEMRLRPVERDLLVGLCV